MTVLVSVLWLCLMYATVSARNDVHSNSLHMLSKQSSGNDLVKAHLWELHGNRFHIKNHRIPLDRKQQQINLHKKTKHKKQSKTPRKHKRRGKKRRKNKKRINRRRNQDRKESSFDLKRPFHVKEPLEIDPDYFPVATFGNFSGNEITSGGKYVENRRKASAYGAHNRWKHLDPHLEKVKKLITRIHNVFRSNVSPQASNMLAVSWDSTAAEHAQKWAEKCKPTAGQDHPSIRWTTTFGTCGQNVHVAFKKKRWRRVARYWWNEKRHFRMGAQNNISLVQHYTQMVWYNSHKVGCGFAECASRNGKSFFRYVCNYCPVGNNPATINEPYKVGPRCESCPNSCGAVCRNEKYCKLCTNSCPFSDLWSNCNQLSIYWKDWLCNTKTAEGISRFKKCRATCQCHDKIS